jgi:hypothetical protein
MRGLGLMIGLCVVATVMVVGAVGSGAWFNDAERVGVGASSARLDVELRVFSQGRSGPSGRGLCASPEGVADHGRPVSWNLSGPGRGDRTESLDQVRCIEVANKPGSLAVKYRFRSRRTAGGTQAFGRIDVLVLRTNCPFGDPRDVIGGPVYSGPLSALNGSDIDHARAYVRPDGSWDGGIPTGGRHCYLFGLHLPRDRDRHGTGTPPVAFDITVDATQMGNPGF